MRCRYGHKSGCRAKSFHRVAVAFATLLVTFTPRAQAATELIETTVQVPVRVRLATRTDVDQPVAMRIIRARTDARRPFLVLLHGRPADAAGRAAIGLAAYPANSRYFAERGFVVLIPTRVGYGVTRGPDVEYTGECQQKRFAPGVDAAVSETRQVVAYAAQLPFVDPARGLVLGESFGGLAAIAVAAADLPGVLGVINIAGGDGGDSLHRTDEPCQPDLLGAAYADYGARNRLATLWLYSANDRLWGTRHPVRWFAAFKGAGGRGRFVALPADKNNGHYIFTRNPPAWQPAFENFVVETGVEHLRP